MLMMPNWAKSVSRFNPVNYLIEVMRMIIIKGSMLTDVTLHLVIVAGFIVVLNMLAVFHVTFYSE